MSSSTENYYQRITGGKAIIIRRMFQQLSAGDRKHSISLKVSEMELDAAQEKLHSNLRRLAWPCHSEIIIPPQKANEQFFREKIQ